MSEEQPQTNLKVLKPDELEPSVRFGEIQVPQKVEKHGPDLKIVKDKNKAEPNNIINFSTASKSRKKPPSKGKSHIAPSLTSKEDSLSRI